MVGKIAFDIRPMHLADIPGAMQLVSGAQWNQTPDDWSMILNTPGSHWVASQNHHIVGTICALEYDTFIWVAMVLVHPEHRRKGIATQLMQKVLDLHHNRVLRLDATEAGAKVYAHFGFRPVDKLVRWQIIASGKIMGSDAHWATKELPELTETINSYDQFVFGGNRIPILSWFSQNYLNQSYVLENSKTPTYSFARPGNHARQLGPIVANNVEEAEVLLLTNLSANPGQKCYLDSFVTNTEWKKKLIHTGFVRQRNFIRMQLGSDKYFGQPKNQFAIAGPELG